MGIYIEVAYAKPDAQIIIPLTVENPCSAAQAIKKSGILQRFPELTIETITAGIFGHVVDLATVLQNNDRIEIYRPLKLDPKAARTQRAKQQPIK